MPRRPSASIQPIYLTSSSILASTQQFFQGELLWCLTHIFLMNVLLIVVELGSALAYRQASNVEVSFAKGFLAVKLERTKLLSFHQQRDLHDKYSPTGAQVFTRRSSLPPNPAYE